MPLPTVLPSERSFDPQTVCVWETGLFDVVAVLDLKTPDGRPVDIEGKTPPLNNRDQVYLVDAPSFGIAAFALRQDGVLIPAAFVESRPGDDG